MMRNIAIALVALMALDFGCKAAHPQKLFVDPGFEPARVGSVLIAPFASSIPEGADPERQSERIMNATLLDLLSERGDYRFLSPEQFKSAVARAGLEDRWQAFKERWYMNHEVDKEFLQKLKVSLNADALLFSHVYLWFKDEADYREEATNSVTQVGATLALLDLGSGAVLWEASDENYREAVRSENREVVQSGGIDRRVAGVSATGRDVYAAPPYEVVAQMVLKALVDALPHRTASK